jgi:hypothetical protein
MTVPVGSSVALLNQSLWRWDNSLEDIGKRLPQCTESRPTRRALRITEIRLLERVV